MSVTLEIQSERLRTRMAALRKHMHRDAQRIAENTNRLFDWRDYVRQFPKGLLAVGMVTGFLIAPRRRVVPSVNLSKQAIEDLVTSRESGSKPQAPLALQAVVIASALKILTGFAMQGLSTVVRSGIEGYLNRQSPGAQNMPVRKESEFSLRRN